MSQHAPENSEPRDRQPRTPQKDIAEHRATAAERLLWTPTEGQDLTKSYFPLTPNSDESDSD